MAVKVKDYILNDATMKAEASLFADSKSDVQNATEADIIGFPEGYTLDFGSSAFTADGDLGYMKSDGSWKWQ